MSLGAEAPRAPYPSLHFGNQIPGKGESATNSDDNVTNIVRQNGEARCGCGALERYRAPAAIRPARIDLRGRVPMFRSPEPGRGAHHSRLIRRFDFIET